MSALVLVHGFWHGSWCWSEVIPYMVAAGRPAVAVDMAGHGLYARRPRWFTEQPYDSETVAAEVSPRRGRESRRCGRAADRADQAGRRWGAGDGGRPQRGRPGIDANGPADARTGGARGVPHRVHAPSDVSAAAYTQIPEAADSLVAPLLQGRPGPDGALRLDLATDDAANRQRPVRGVLRGDVDRGLADAASGLLTPDSPGGIMMGTTTLTREGWGSVPRTYIVCTNDQALRPAVQEKFIAEADAAFPGNPTSVVRLEASHSPFFSMPGELAKNSHPARPEQLTRGHRKARRARLSGPEDRAVRAACPG